MLRRAALAVLFFVLTPATVHAFDHDHHHDSDGDGGGGCGSSATPTSAPAPSLTTPSSSNAHVFVTSTLFSGAVGSVPDADQQCQTIATGAGLGGTFRAWMSDPYANAIDHVGATGPLYATNDALVFSDGSALASATPSAAILDEHGQSPSRAGALAVWTGSDESGRASGHDCAGWTDATVLASGTTGSASLADPLWGGGSAPIACNQKASLLCVQIGF